MAEKKKTPHRRARTVTPKRVTAPPLPKTVMGSGSSKKTPKSAQSWEARPSSKTTTSTSPHRQRSHRQSAHETGGERVHVNETVTNKHAAEKLGEPEPNSRDLGDGRLGVANGNEVTRVYNSISPGKVFVDKGFAAQSPYLAAKDRNSSDIKWLRPKQLVRKPCFYVDGIGRNDIAQGSLGDCWFLSSCAAVAAKPELMEKVIPGGQVLHGEGYKGAFRFRFWRFGQWVDVLIDDKLPVSGKHQRLIYARGVNPSEFWVALLEKAYAKIHGGYAAIEGGQAMDALVDLTGGLAERYEMADHPGSGLYHKLAKAASSGAFITCSRKGDWRSQDQNADKNGLIAGHAYTISDVKQIKRVHGIENLIRIRNPWGMGMEWKGAWCDKHDKVKCHSIECEDRNHGIKRKLKPRKRKNPKKPVKDKKSSDTAGLSTTLELGVGARVMLRRNLDTKTGLVNGALGYVEELNTGGDSSITSIVVQFDDIAEPQTIEKVCADYELAPSLFVTRVQFPLVLAYAMTIHKSQGLTLDSVLVDLGGSFSTNGMAYVALSRVTKFEGLHLIRLDIRKIRADKKCILEYNRLRQTNPSTNPPPIDRFNCLPQRFRTKEIKPSRKRRMTVNVELPDPDEPAVGVSPKKTQRKRTIVKKRRPTKRVLFTTPPTTTRVALRLTNTLSESCYANALIQALLRGSAFRERFTNCRLTRNDDANVRQAWINIVTLYNDGTTLETNVDSLREAVNARYARGTGQHSLHNFFYEFMAKLPSCATLLTMRNTIYNECSACQRRTRSTTEPCLSYSIGRAESARNKTSFRDQFTEALTSKLTEVSCPCGSYASVRKEQLQITPTTKNVALFLATQTQTQPRRVLYGSITDFTADDVTIPGCNERFRTIAAIFHEGVDETGGHFYTFARHNGVWLRLDCLKANLPTVTSLPQGLKGVMMLLLEKID